MQIDFQIICFESVGGAINCVPEVVNIGQSSNQEDFPYNKLVQKSDNVYLPVLTQIL
jgi:hypothetical protein